MSKKLKLLCGSFSAHLTNPNAGDERSILAQSKVIQEILKAEIVYAQPNAAEKVSGLINLLKEINIAAREVHLWNPRPFTPQSLVMKQLTDLLGDFAALVNLDMDDAEVLQKKISIMTEKSRVIQTMCHQQILDLRQDPDFTQFLKDRETCFRFSHLSHSLLQTAHVWLGA